MPIPVPVIIGIGIPVIIGGGIGPVIIGIIAGGTTPGGGIIGGGAIIGGAIVLPNAIGNASLGPSCSDNSIPQFTGLSYWLLRMYGQITLDRWSVRCILHFPIGRVPTMSANSACTKKNLESDRNSKTP
jgi:hypothetical protein